MSMHGTPDEIVWHAVEAASGLGLVRRGDLVGVLVGSPQEVEPTTDVLRLVRVGCPSIRRGSRAASEGLELHLGLGQLGVGVGVGDDAVAGDDAGRGAVDVGTADADREGAVAAGVDPADRAGVAAAVEALVLGDPRLGASRGQPLTAGRRVEGRAPARGPTGPVATGGPRPCVARCCTLATPTTDGSGS